MADVVFVTWWGGGNLTPLYALGPQLLERGHRVRVVCDSAAVVERFAAEGVECAGRVDELPSVLASGVDVALVDFMMPHALCESIASPARTVALVHLFVEGIALTIGAFTTLESINARRSELGMAALAEPADLLDEVDLQLVAVPRCLDTGRDASGSERVIHACLIPDAGSDDGWQPPDGDAPLVVVSLGTTPQGEERLLQEVLDAVGTLDARGVATLGPHLTPGAFRGPTNVVVSGHIRHAAVLPHASVLVSHCGQGTVQVALANGVPLALAPIDRDQPFNAGRLAELGVGVIVDKEAHADEIAAAINEVLANPSYREAAQAIARQIAADQTDLDRLWRWLDSVR